MPKYKPTTYLKKWLDDKSIVIVGYFDEVKAVNLDYLLASWVDAIADGESLNDVYPYAADHFQVEVFEKDDPRLDQQGSFVRSLKKDFLYCTHLKVWVEGEVMDKKDIEQILLDCDERRSQP